MSRFIDEHRGRFGVEPNLQGPGRVASAYYQRATGRRSDASSRTSARSSASASCAANYYAYGYRKMWLALTRAGESVGRDQCQAPDAPAGHPGAPSAAASRGAPRRRTRRRRAAPISSTATSRPTGPTRCGSPTSRTCAATRGWWSSASSSTSTPRRIVGWQFASHMRTDLVLDALRITSPSMTSRPQSSRLCAPDGTLDLSL